MSNECEACTKPVTYCLYCLLTETPENKSEERIKTLIEMHVKAKRMSEATR